MNLASHKLYTHSTEPIKTQRKYSRAWYNECDRVTIGFVLLLCRWQSAASFLANRLAYSEYETKAKLSFFWNRNENRCSIFILVILLL